MSACKKMFLLHTLALRAMFFFRLKTRTRRVGISESVILQPLLIALYISIFVNSVWTLPTRMSGLHLTLLWVHHACFQDGHLGYQNESSEQNSRKPIFSLENYSWKQQASEAATAMLKMNALKPKACVSNFTLKFGLKTDESPPIRTFSYSMSSCF